MSLKAVKQGKLRGVASVLPVKVVPCIKGRGSYERFFEYKFEPLETTLANVATEESQQGGLAPGVLGALVMPNAICVLVASEASGTPSQLASVSFEEKVDGTMELSTDAISGKKKKGARRVKAGHRMCSFTYTDGTSRNMLSPVSGCVLEVNHSQLISNPSLVQSEPFGRGFIAVVQPEHDLMSTLEASNGVGVGADGAFAKFNSKSGPDEVTTGIGVYGDTTYGGPRSGSGSGGGGGGGGGAAVPEKETGGKRVTAGRIIGKPCFAFTNTGGCLRGDACRFDHIVVRENGDQEVVNPRLKKRRKVEPCYDFIAGKCHRGDECGFLHGIDEQTAVDK